MSVSQVPGPDSTGIPTTPGAAAGAGTDASGAFAQDLEDILAQEDEGVSLTATLGDDGSVTATEAKGDRSSGVFAPKKSLDKQDFLFLLTAQMKFQDPLNPQDNGDFIAQLAQFSSLEANNNILEAIKDLKKTVSENQDSTGVVDAITGLHDTVKSSAAQSSALSVSDTLSSVALLNRTVRMASDSVKVTQPGEYMSIKVHNSSKTPLTLVIKDASGTVVDRMKLLGINPDSQDGIDGYKPNGDGVFTWDGNGLDSKPVKTGVYTLELETAEGVPVSGQDYLYGEGTVDSVDFGSNGVTLTVKDADTGKAQDVSLATLIRVGS